MNEAAITIYRRSEAYYLVVSAQTTAGLWQHVGETPTLLSGACLAADLGREALDRLAEPQPTTPHPRQQQWAEARRTSLAPIMRSANVRTWRAFITGATMVDVARSNDMFTVTRMQPLPKPQGAFAPDIDRQQTLRSPSAESLGRAIFEAFAGEPHV